MRLIGSITNSMKNIKAMLVSILRWWFVILPYAQKFGIGLIGMGIGLIVQPFRGLGWFIYSQLPWQLHTSAYGAVFVAAGVMMLVLSASDRRVLKYQRYLLLPLVFYLVVALLAAFQEFPLPPPELRPSGQLRLSIAGLVDNIMLLDFMISSLVRRDYAIEYQ